VDYHGLGSFVSFKDHQISPAGTEYSSKDEYLKSCVAIDVLESELGNVADEAYWGADGQLYAPTVKQLGGDIGALVLCPYTERTGSHNGRPSSHPTARPPQLIDLNFWEPMDPDDERNVMWTDG